MMGTKIYFNDEVHRILKLPDTLTALVNVIQSTFENKLPENWTLYHTDPEGISIPVSTEDQYKTIVETESVVPSSTPKFYIVPNEPIAANGANVVNVVEGVAPQSPDLNKIVSDVAKKLGYLDIEDQNNDNVFQDEILMTKPASQNNREQMAQANDEASTSPQKMEVNPQAGPQPKDEERKNKKRLHKAKHLIKKLFYSRMPECKKNWLIEKLESIQRKLTPRQREKLQRKKESVMMKSRKKHHKREKKDGDQDEEEGFHRGYRHGFRGHHGHHGYHGHHGFHGYHGHHGRFGYHEYPEYDQENLRKVVLLSKQKIEENGMDLDAVNSQLPLVSTTGQMETETRVSPVNPEGKPVHTNVVCSGCGMAPIVGVRYRCSVCTYFDFCEKCEETKKHPHLFLKVREDEPKAIRAPISVGSQQDGDNTIKILPAKNMMKAFKKVKKMIKAIKRGNIKKFNECHEKLFKHYPEEAKRVLETAEDWYPEGNEGLRQEWKRMKHQKGGKVRELGYWGRRRGADDWMRGEAMTSQEVERQYRFMNRSMADLHIGEAPSNR